MLTVASDATRPSQLFHPHKKNHRIWLHNGIQSMEKHGIPTRSYQASFMGSLLDHVLPGFYLLREAGGSFPPKWFASDSKLNNACAYHTRFEI